jgi:ribosomal protein S18 acetylase RimI-like enzyme
MPEIAAPSIVIRSVPVDDALLHTHVLEAELDGQVVGHGLVRLIRSRKRRIGRIGLHADERFGDRGVSRALLERLLQLADRQRLDCLEVEVLANNAPAIELYESAGFVAERTDHDRQALVMVRARQP